MTSLLLTVRKDSFRTFKVPQSNAVDWPMLHENSMAIVVSLKSAFLATSRRSRSPIDELGMTLPHEHALVAFVGADHVTRDHYNPDELFRAILPHLKRVRELGFRSLAECAPAYLGRDPRLLKRLSDRYNAMFRCQTTCSPVPFPLAIASDCRADC